MDESLFNEALSSIKEQMKTESGRDKIERDLNLKTEEMIMYLKQTSRDKLELFVLLSVFDMIRVCAELRAPSREEAKALLIDELSMWPALVRDLSLADPKVVALGAALSSSATFGFSVLESIKQFYSVASKEEVMKDEEK